MSIVLIAIASILKFVIFLNITGATITNPGLSIVLFVALSAFQCLMFGWGRIGVALAGVLIAILALQNVFVLLMLPPVHGWTMVFEALILILIALKEGRSG